MSLSRFLNTSLLSGAILSSVLGEGCEPNDTAVAPAPAPPITVNGIVQNPFGTPVSGATVIIADKPPVTTGSNGTFSVPNVAPPYDATLIGADSQAILYEGLTRQDPRLNTLNVTGITDKEARITGTVPAFTTQTTLVFFVSGTISGRDYADPTTGAFSMSLEWYDTTTSLAGKLSVLRWNSANGFPTFYDAFGSRNLTVSDGGVYPSNDFVPSEMVNPSEQNITGTISPPAAFTLTSKRFLINLEDASVLVAQESGSALPATFNFTVPLLDGFTFQVNAGASGPDGRTSHFLKKGITGGTSNILIRLDTPPHLTVPLSGATGVDSATQFQWTAGAGVYLVSVRPSGSGSPPRFTILTMNTSTYLPNLTAFGLGLPPGTLYHWDVTQFAPVSSVDFAASNDFHPLVYLFGEGGEIGFGESERFSFTTHQ